VCSAVALENLSILQRERVVEGVRDRAAPYLQRRWQELAAHPLVGEARGLGLLGALELVRGKEPRQWFEPRGKVGERCRDICIRNGLVMRATRDTMIIAPPLVITDREIDELVEKAWRSLDETLAELRCDGLC
jgi:putrescine aminotransferase